MSALPIDLDALAEAADEEYCYECSGVYGLQGEELAALVRAVRAAQALIRLPDPVTPDEFVDWGAHHDRLREALAPFAAPAAAEEPQP